jgi:hypothetical protein
VDWRPPLTAVTSGLVFVAIGYGCGGAPPAEPPAERHNFAPVEQGAEEAEAQIAPNHQRDAVEVQYEEAPPVEYPPDARNSFDLSVGTGAVEVSKGQAMAPPIPGRGAPVSAAIIRAYFARRFLYEAWYLHVRDIDVHRRFASIVAWHLNGSRAPKQARGICDAALSLKRLRGASVRFGSRSVNCSSASGPER